MGYPRRRVALEKRKGKNVLVGCHDESTPLFNTLLERVARNHYLSSFCSHGVVMWRVIVLAVVQSALLAIGQVFLKFALQKMHPSDGRRISGGICSSTGSSLVVVLSLEPALCFGCTSSSIIRSV